jgi:hypothetical protein
MTMFFTKRSYQTRLLPVVVGLVAILLATSPVLASEQVGTVVRVFNLQHISVMEASNAVDPILSVHGSLTLQPRRSRLTVQDRPEIVEKVAHALAKIDRSPGQFWIQVELLEGRDASLPKGQRADVDVRLQRMFPFDAYQRIGSTRFEGIIGETLEADLGSGYQLSFVVELFDAAEESMYHIPDTDSRLVLQSLVLERVISNSKGAPAMLELVRTRVVLSESQEAFIGAAGSEESESGVVLILKSLPKEEH